MMKNIFLICVFMILFSCKSEKKTDDEVRTEPTVQTFQRAAFNADSAYAFIKAQCDFGPRTPNSPSHIACGNYLETKMREWADTVYIQSGVVKAYDGTMLRFKNIISSFNPENTDRILLFAHWDTRPWADKDTINKKEPIIGADDGASGVGILMEIARQLALDSPATGIDIIFFDAEDWGEAGGGPGSENTYALGAQHWTKNLHVPNYTARYGILLDMTGAKDAQFRFEGLSYQMAASVVQKVWKTAATLGYSNYFLNQDGGWITDDHVYVNQIGIPSIDIINSNLSTSSGFAKHWHTHADNMDIIDINTVRAVGETVATAIRH